MPLLKASNRMCGCSGNDAAKWKWVRKQNKGKGRGKNVTNPVCICV